MDVPRLTYEDVKKMRAHGRTLHVVSLPYTVPGKCRVIGFMIVPGEGFDGYRVIVEPEPPSGFVELTEFVGGSSCAIGVSGVASKAALVPTLNCDRIVFDRITSGSWRPARWDETGGERCPCGCGARMVPEAPVV